MCFGRCRYACSVNASSGLHGLGVLSETSEDQLVGMPPNAGSHPFVKATPTCRSTAAAEFARQVLPWYSSLDEEQDYGQSSAIINTWPSGLWQSIMDRKMNCYHHRSSGRIALAMASVSVYEYRRHVSARANPAYVRCWAKANVL